MCNVEPKYAVRAVIETTTQWLDNNYLSSVQIKHEGATGKVSIEIVAIQKHHAISKSCWVRSRQMSPFVRRTVTVLVPMRKIVAHGPTEIPNSERKLWEQNHGAKDEVLATQFKISTTDTRKARLLAVAMTHVCTCNTSIRSLSFFRVPYFSIHLSQEHA